MAHVKQKGGYKGSGDSESKRLGIKLYAGQSAKPGSIIVRQRGNRFYAGENVKQGKDYTLFATKEGRVSFKKKKKLLFNGSKKYIKVVNVK